MVIILLENKSMRLTDISMKGLQTLFLPGVDQHKSFKLIKEQKIIGCISPGAVPTNFIIVRNEFCKVKDWE